MRCSVCGCTVVYVYMWVLFPWVLGIGVMFAGFLAWFQNMGNTFDIVSLYQVFPILGIWAWSLMWTHFAIWEIRRLKPSLPGNRLYSKVSGTLVFWLLLLHPGILAVEQFRQGKGLPPFSYFAYAGEASVWLILLGIVGLTGFLFYEVAIRFQNNVKVKRFWWLVNITQTVAMASIFFTDSIWRGFARRLVSHILDLLDYSLFPVYFTPTGLI